MQGSKPAARRLAQPSSHSQGLADGGSVGFGARGLNELRQMVPLVEAMGYRQQPPAPAPAPASDPRAAQLLAMIPKMEAMGYRQAAAPQVPQYFAKGGMVRGPGTGTSDSIATEAEPGTFIMPADSTKAIGPDALAKLGTMPVRLSDGEFEIPPEQVMALGAAVLKLMKDATHKPVNGEDGGQTDAEVGEGGGEEMGEGAAHEQAEAAAGGVEDDPEEGAQGFQPGARERMARMPMFADGGLVDPRRPNSFGDAAAVAADPGVTQVRTSAADTFGSTPAPAPAGALSRAASMATPPAPEPVAQPLSALADSTAQPTTRSMDAADGLARRGAADALARMPNAPAPIQAPTIRHSGNDWQARNDLRNLEVSAKSIMNRPEWSKAGMGRFNGQQGPSVETAAYQSALANDLALRAAQPGMDQAAMRENADLQRAGLQTAAQAAEGAANRQNDLTRTLIGERGANQRATISALGTTEAARIKAAQENKAPAGYRWGAGGSLEAIPGGPAAAKVAEEQKTKESALDASRQTIGTINRLLASPGREGATGLWNLNRFIPGNQSADFAAEVETLKAQTFLPMVQQLRGMGALSNAEGEKLNAAVGALNFNMSEKAFAESLGRIRDQFGAALQRSGVDTKDVANWGLEAPTSAAEQGTRTPGTPAATAPAPSLPGGMTRQVGTSGGRPVYEDAQGNRFIGG